MRLRKGSKVEVLSKREKPSGSWFPAEIVSGNGHYYHVKYDGFSLNGGIAMGKVRRKGIRPCPPPMEISGSCVLGEIVEVFENSSWKAAKIVDVLGSGNYSVIMLGGSSDKLEVEKCNVRIPQSWSGDRWVLVNKESEKLNEGKTEMPCERGKVDKQRLQQYAEVRHLKKCGKRDDEPYRISLRGLKIRLDNKAGAGRKMGAARKVGKRQSLFPKMVDSCAPSQIIYGENYMDASLNKRTPGLPDSGMNWGNPNEDVHFFLGSLEHSNTDSLSSSVGSCSPFNSQHRSFDHPKSINFNDDEAWSCSGTEPFEPTKEGAVEIHRLELNAYHLIIMALYASGPLSWEREALLTNLRLMLHITNDEHLLELRTIKSDSA